MAKNHYLKIIEVLNAAQSLAARMNSFVKIATETEDAQLRKLLMDAVKLIRPTIANGGGTKKGVLAPHQVWADLHKYCVNQANTQKPEWQILAERAGWRPPSAE